MVASFLQSELAEELKNILADLRLKSPQGEKSSINIFEQFLPVPQPQEQKKTEVSSELLENGLVEEQTDPDPFPYIIVRISDGEIKDENSAQTVSVILLIGTYEPDFDKQGYKDIMNIITKIYERFAKMPVLNGKYTIQYPILWAIQDEESYPYYYGGMSLLFETAAVRREHPYA